MIPAQVLSLFIAMAIVCNFSLVPLGIPETTETPHPTLYAIPGEGAHSARGDPPRSGGRVLPPRWDAPATAAFPNGEAGEGKRKHTGEAETDTERLACAIYSEAGGDACSDECRIDVGDVVLNRVEDSRFPDTLEGVLTAPRQYGRFSVTGVIWPERAKDPGEAHAVERAYRIAEQLLAGEHGELYKNGYVWQAEFEQGSDGFWLDGLYFGR